MAMDANNYVAPVGNRFVAVVNNEPVGYYDTQAEAEAAYRKKRKEPEPAVGPSIAITPAHREGLRLAGYPDWNNPNLTEADWQRISTGAQRGGGGAATAGGGGVGGPLDVLPTWQMEHELNMIREEYLKRRLEELELPEMLARTESERHRLALDAATRFAEISGYYYPQAFIELSILKDLQIAAGLPEEAALARQGITKSDMYNTINGPRTMAQMEAELRSPNIGWDGRNDAGQPEDAATAYARTTKSPVTVQAQAGVPAVAPTTQTYNTVNGPKTTQQMDSELRQAGWNGTNDQGQTEDVTTAYARTTNSPVTPSAPTVSTLPVAAQAPQAGIQMPAVPPGLAPSYLPPGAIPTFEREKYLAELAANPRNLVQALLMLGMSPEQAASFLQGVPLINQLLNQGGWAQIGEPTGSLGYAPSYPGVGAPGAQPTVATQPVATQPPTVATQGITQAQPLTTPSQVAAQTTTAGGQSTMPTTPNYPTNWPGTPTNYTWPTTPPWRTMPFTPSPEHYWGEATPYERKAPPTSMSLWQPPAGFDLNTALARLLQGQGGWGGQGQQASTLGLGAAPQASVMGLGAPAQAAQASPYAQSNPYRGGAGNIGIRNPQFPFITGRQLPVRWTLNALETQSPLIEMLKGLFSFSGQEPGAAFGEFQSFLPKGSVASPTTYY